MAGNDQQNAEGLESKECAEARQHVIPSRADGEGRPKRWTITHTKSALFEGVRCAHRESGSGATIPYDCEVPRRLRGSG